MKRRKGAQGLFILKVSSHQEPALRNEDIAAGS
jgi:hypothetical protein